MFLGFATTAPASLASRMKAFTALGASYLIDLAKIRLNSFSNVEKFEYYARMEQHKEKVLSDFYGIDRFSQKLYSSLPNWKFCKRWKRWTWLLASRLKTWKGLYCIAHIVQTETSIQNTDVLTVAIVHWVLTDQCYMYKRISYCK